MHFMGLITTLPLFDQCRIYCSAGLIKFKGIVKWRDLTRLIEHLFDSHISVTFFPTSYQEYFYSIQGLPTFLDLLSFIYNSKIYDIWMVQVCSVHLCMCNSCSNQGVNNFSILKLDTKILRLSWSWGVQILIPGILFWIQ